MNKNIYNKIKINKKFSYKRKITLKDTKNFIKIVKDENKLHKIKINNKILVHGFLLNSLIARVLGTVFVVKKNLLVSCSLRYLGQTFVNDTIKIDLKIKKIIKLFDFISFDIRISVEKKNVALGECTIKLI
tara:strand:+ start:302 stop:694 length:393 start_codon:yes stop_codon:yes gene_type:complete